MSHPRASAPNREGFNGQGGGWLVSAAMSAALSMAVAPVAAQAGQAQAAQTPLPPDPEAEREPEAPAAVVLGGETVLLVPGPPALTPRSSGPDGSANGCWR